MRNDDNDLRGLDYFTVEQAARYCGLSVSAFRAEAEKIQLARGKALTTRRVLYRREDLRRAIEWHGFGGHVQADTAPPPKRRGRPVLG